MDLNGSQKAHRFHMGNQPGLVLTRLRPNPKEGDVGGTIGMDVVPDEGLMMDNF